MFQYFQLYFLILFPFFLLNVEAKFNDDDHPAPLRGDIDEEESQFFKFYTRPDLQAPKFDVHVFDEDALSNSPGHWFVAPYAKLEGTERGPPYIGPYIYDQKGELIWAGPPTMDRYKTFDLRVSDFNGTDMLTVIYPHDNAGLILDSGYSIVKRVIHSDSWGHSNMHDFNIVQNGTRALVLTKAMEKQVSLEKSKAVGYNGTCTVREDGIKYLDISQPGSPKELFVWNGTDHIGLDETTFKKDNASTNCQNNWDIHHFNSIDLFPDGDFLLSSRHTDTIYKVSQNGSIVWRLGGVKSDFHFGPQAEFSRQHHARVHSQNNTHTIITCFDNAIGTGPYASKTHKNSRGLLLALRTDVHPMVAEIVQHFDHPRGAMTSSRGSTQMLPNGNAFMNWAYNTLISEHAPDGTLLMEARFKKKLHTYRAYKYEWVGHPTEPPNVYSAAFVAGTNTTTMVYVSWNGATEVSRWNLLEVDASSGTTKVLGSAPRNGFETALSHNGTARYVIVEALDRNNKSIGTSRVVETILPVEHSDEDDIDRPTAIANAPFSPSVVAASAASHSKQPTRTAVSVQDDWTSMHSEYNNRHAGMLDVLSNPVAAFVTGFVACAVICGVSWAISQRKVTMPWYRQDKSAYQPLDQENETDAMEYSEAMQKT